MNFIRKSAYIAALSAATVLSASSMAAAVELTFWHHTYPPAREFIEKKAAEFTAQHPDITIKLHDDPHGDYEVKLLAAQTARATDEIGAKIAEIQAATGETVTSIGRIVSTIETIRTVTAAISGAVEEQGAATEEIAVNTQRAAAGTLEVTGIIGGVGSAAVLTGTAAGRLMGLSDNLDGQSGRLQAEVSDFVRQLKAV